MDTKTRSIPTGETINSGMGLNTQSLLSIYQEICKSIHDVDDFRMKLLGLLPLTSLVGIFALGNNSLSAPQTSESKRLIAFIGIFAASLTLSLFIYEIRGILRCHDLILSGREIEELLGVKGQFHVCMEEHKCKKEGKDWTERANNFFDAKLAACVIYSTVLTAWIFTALHFGFGLTIPYCTFLALGIGLFIGLGTFFFVRRLIAA
jgi:hypothetical protein